MQMPPPTGNPLIDGAMPLFRLIDDAAKTEPALMWLVWAMSATSLAALPALAGRVRSMFLSLLLVIPGTLLLVASFTVLSTVIADVVRLNPFLNIAVALAVNAAVVLAGWRYAASSRQMHSAEVTLRLARPVLLFSVLFLSLAFLPFTAPAAIPPLFGVAVFLTEALSGRMLVASLQRASTSRSSASLLRFGCLAPVYVVPDTSMSFDAVAVGLRHASSAVFVRQHVEDALQSVDPVAVRRATHILAHEAGHVVQQHGVWRAIALSIVAAVLPFIARGSGFASLAAMSAIVVVLGLGAVALAESAAERFARRATMTPESSPPAMGAFQ